MWCLSRTPDVPLSSTRGMSDDAFTLLKDTTLASLPMVSVFQLTWIAGWGGLKDFTQTQKKFKIKRTTWRNTSSELSHMLLHYSTSLALIQLLVTAILFPLLSLAQDGPPSCPFQIEKNSFLSVGYLEIIAVSLCKVQLSPQVRVI